MFGGLRSEAVRETAVARVGVHRRDRTDVEKSALMGSLPNPETMLRADVDVVREEPGDEASAVAAGASGAGRSPDQTEQIGVQKALIEFGKCPIQLGR